MADETFSELRMRHVWIAGNMTNYGHFSGNVVIDGSPRSCASGRQQNLIDGNYTQSCALTLSH